MTNAEQDERNFFQRHLDPASRLGEILFGLIMVLTITLTTGLTVDSGPEGVRQLLVAAVGCNIAWGLIDGVMYVMNCMTVRSAKVRLILAVRNAGDRQAALQIVRRSVDAQFLDLERADDCETMYEAMLRRSAQAMLEKTRVTKDDLHGAAACFGLVFVSCLPAAAPFLIFSSPRSALRVSNFLLIGLLFLVGQKWAHYINANRLLAGLAMVAIGLALVGVAALLGG
jgi:hypothetical protein